VDRGWHARASILKRTAWAIALAAAVVGALTVLTGYAGGAVFVDQPPRAVSPRELSGVGAVILSGDMGFSVGMGRQVSDRLVHDGIPVTGVNSLAFFRRHRTPDEDRALVASAIRRALAVPGTRRVVLIGQSFGADMLQAGLAGLDPALRATVMDVVLVVPEDTLEYRASPSNLLDMGEPQVPALPTARRLDWVPTLCIRGKKETDSLCPLLSSGNVEHVVLPGGHPLHRDSDRVYRAVIRSVIQAAERPVGRAGLG
jgi:type IV secretory pathway VirJ component